MPQLSIDEVNALRRPKEVGVLFTFPPLVTERAKKFPASISIRKKPLLPSREDNLTLLLPFENSLCSQIK